GLRIVMMCELPSNAVLAEQFLELFDGFSIGSNDLTQLTLGLDRDSGLVAEGFDERDAAVKAMLSMAIRACRKQGKYVGICGQGPSDHPDLRSEEHTSELQSQSNLVCRLLLEKKKKTKKNHNRTTKCMTS